MRGRWLTPNTADTTAIKARRVISLPGALYSYVVGALLMLTYESRWEEFGDMTPAETAVYFQNILDDIQEATMPVIGQISQFVDAAVIPPGWLQLIGSTIPQSNWPELTAVVPNSWLSGTDIILPDMRSGHGLVMSGTKPGFVGLSNGAVGGSADHLLAASEMPTHNHTVNTDTYTVGVAAGTDEYVVRNMLPSISGNAGATNAHNNMPPYLAVRFAIYAKTQ